MEDWDHERQRKLKNWKHLRKIYSKVHIQTWFLSLSLFTQLSISIYDNDDNHLLLKHSSGWKKKNQLTPRTVQNCLVKLCRSHKNPAALKMYLTITKNERDKCHINLRFKDKAFYFSLESAAALPKH